MWPTAGNWTAADLAEQRQFMRATLLSDEQTDPDMRQAVLAAMQEDDAAELAERKAARLAKLAGRHLAAPCTPPSAQVAQDREAAWQYMEACLAEDEADRIAHQAGRRSGSEDEDDADMAPRKKSRLASLAERKQTYLAVQADSQLEDSQVADSQETLVAGNDQADSSHADGSQADRSQAEDTAMEEWAAEALQSVQHREAEAMADQAPAKRQSQQQQPHQQQPQQQQPQPADQQQPQQQQPQQHQPQQQHGPERMRELGWDRPARHPSQVIRNSHCRSDSQEPDSRAAAQEIRQAAQASGSSQAADSSLADTLDMADIPDLADTLADTLDGMPDHYRTKGTQALQYAKRVRAAQAADSSQTADSSQAADQTAQAADSNQAADSSRQQPGSRQQPTYLVVPDMPAVAPRVSPTDCHRPTVGWIRRLRSSDSLPPPDSQEADSQEPDSQGPDSQAADTQADEQQEWLDSWRAAALRAGTGPSGSQAADSRQAALGPFRPFGPPSRPDSGCSTCRYSQRGCYRCDPGQARAALQRWTALEEVD